MTVDHYRLVCELYLSLVSDSYGQGVEELRSHSQIIILSWIRTVFFLNVLDLCLISIF